MGVIAMPLFFITNGYLLFGKSNKDTFYSYKKRDNILSLVFIWNLLFTALYFALKRKPSNPFNNSINNLFFQSGNFGHFWFLGALLIIYVVFPLLDKIYIKNEKCFIFIAITLVCLQIIVDGINIYSSINHKVVFQQLIPQTFRIESHLSYFVIGGIIKRYNKQLKKYISLLLICIVYAFLIFYQFYMIKNIYSNLHCEFFYNSIITIVLSMSIFLYISNKNLNNNIIARLSKLIMLIYIIHPFVINLYNKYIRVNINIIKLLSVFFISMIISWIIVKIPYTEKLYKI
jgi:surface polysaccharide O-acyltransferase-like enzyme